MTTWSHSRRSWRAARGARRTALAAVLWGLACAAVSGGLGLVASDTDHLYTTFWPTTAVAALAMLRCGPAAIPAILLAIATVTALAGGGVLMIAGEALAVATEAVIVAVLLQRTGLGGREIPARGLGIELPVIALLAPGGAAVIFGLAWAAATGTDLGHGVQMLASWWLSESVALLSFLPLLLVWQRPPRLGTGRHGLLAALLAGHLVVAALVFSGKASDWIAPAFVSYLVFPLGLLISVNAGTHLATLAVAALAALGLAGTLRGLGPFAQGLPVGGPFLLELFVAVAGGSMLFVHALAATQRDAARRLRERVERFRSFAALSADWYWETDTNQRFIHVSGPAVDDGRLPAGLLLGTDRWDAGAEVTLEERERHDTAVARREAFRDIVMSRNGQDDSLRQTCISGEPVHDTAGIFQGYRGVGHDISLLKRAEQEVAHSRQFLSALIDALPTPALVKDENHRYTDANTAFLQFFQRPREEILGRTDHDFFDAADADYFRDADRAALGGESRVTYERPYRIKDTTRWMLVHKTALTAPDRRRYLLLLMLDVTDRRNVEERVRESEQRFRSLTELSADWYWEQDRNCRFTYLSPTAIGKVAAAPSELLGKTRHEAGFDWESEHEMAEHRTLLAARRPFRDLILHIPKSGRWALSSGEPVFGADGEFLGYRGVGRDITELKMVENQLRESERRFRDFAEAASEFVWEQDRSGAYTYLSPRVSNVLGYSDADLIGRRAADYMPPEEAERVASWLHDHARRDGSYKDLEHMLITRSGALIWVSVNAVATRTVEGQLTGYRGTARDITDRKAAEERISQLATRDALTGLPNRVLLHDRLEQGLVNARRNRASLALMFVDLDRFKTINDSLGHDVGDQLLQEVAARMQTCIRKGDTLARLGGDEFVVTLEGLQQAEDAAQVGEKIIAALARPIEVRSHNLSTSCSIGISIFPDDAQDAPTLMKNADTAMYHAKEKGRRNYQFFSREMNIRAVERHDLETALRLALDRDEFVLHFQPQIDIASGRLAGVEALLRWRHPDKGLVLPSTFIEVAEETGLIEPIGAWVLRAACEQARAWQDAGYPAIRVAINVSARQFHHPTEFARSVQRTLARTSLDPSCLELEMTESVLWQTAEDSIQAFRRLGKLGTRLAVDDFGTGYSSLTNLKQLPVDTLKVDRSFVRDVVSDKGSEVIVATIVGMAHSLDLRVTAEGVEDLAQLSALKRLGCDEYQGFLFSKPVPAADIARRYLAPRQLNFGS
ncbi:MAG: EAL domain-containing protein [Betaproteobacteria bacterium]